MAFAPTVEAAHHVCVLSSYADLKASLSRADRNATAGLMLAATVWQCEGDVVRAEATLRRAVERAGDDERAYVVDLLAPLLISRGLFTRAASVLATVRSPALALGRGALRAVIDAAGGVLRRAEQFAADVRDGLARLDDDVVRMQIHQRLALAAYYRADAAAALEDSAEGLRLARMLGADRFACHLHSVIYATHYTWSGDADAAWRDALAIEAAAQAGGDRSHLAFARVATYELAAERGDTAALDRLRETLQRDPLPEQYRERFAAGIAEVLRLSWAGEFASARNIVMVLKDMHGRSDGERALCKALFALFSAGIGDDDAARRFSRQAISNSARPEKRAVAHELRYRRLARAIAAATGDAIGDVVRGRRAAEARFLRDDPQIAALIAVRTASDADRAGRAVRGYALAIAAAREQLELRPSAGPLTAAEVEIVRMVSRGKNAPQIGAVLGRSTHTVRTHIRNACAKLEAHGRLELIARARNLGLLAEP